MRLSVCVFNNGSNRERGRPTGSRTDERRSGAKSLNKPLRSNDESLDPSGQIPVSRVSSSCFTHKHS